MRCSAGLPGFVCLNIVLQKFGKGSNVARQKSVVIQRETLRSQVVAALREAIVDGTLAPGEKLVERELCEWLAVSRTSLREALRQLETEGWILMAPFCGPSVRALTPADVVEIYQVRTALESYAVTQYCRRATPKDDASLRHALDVMARAVDQGSARRQADAVRLFYAAILSPLANAHLEKALLEQEALLGWLRRTSLSTQQGSRRSFEEKRDLCRALIARNESEARRACEVHLERACERVRTALIERLSQIEAMERSAGAA